MNQPELRSLAGVPLEVVHAAFLAAFADYAVPMQLDLAALATMLTPGPPKFVCTVGKLVPAVHSGVG